jgi:asparagine synthase (glutamine-hydrolysing)
MGVTLTTHCKSRTALDEASLAELAASQLPAIGGVDADRDRDEVERLRATGATAIVSGQGGDGLFFQFPTALVVADEFRRRGWATLGSPLLADIARRTRQSVWGVLAQVRAARRGAERRPTLASTLLAAETRAFAGDTEHAWTREARSHDLPPGKVLHIQGIALAHFYRGPSRRLAEAEILLPFLSQPILELCLSIAVPDLAGGSYDRPFARHAFADRLPEAVVARRAKGAQSVYFAKLVAGRLDWLRPYLLDGRLCDAGLLDRGLLERTLDPQQLIWGRGAAPMDVLNAAATEAWVRHWQARRPDSTKHPRYRAG